MAILVTGGAGFIGSNFILQWLSHADEPIVNLDALTYAGNPENLAAVQDNPAYRFVRGSITDRDTVDHALTGQGIRAVIHFAAESHVDRSIHNPDAFVQTNIVGTFNLLHASLSYWNTLPPSEKEAFRFLHVSTDEVYGTLAPDDPAFTESTPYAPNSPYAASKASSDHLVRAYHHTYGLPTLVTNCSNNYGPFQFPEKLIPLCIHNALQGKPLPIYGDGRQIRDWLYVKDHCRALQCVLDHGTPGEVYNIGGCNEIMNIEIVRSICARLDAVKPRTDGSSYADQITHVPDRPGHDRRYAIDAAKIRRELGWAPEETFESGIGKTVQWYLENGTWLERVTSGAYRDWVDVQYGSRQ